MRLATATSWSTWTIYWYLETRLRSTPRSRPSRSRSYSSTSATSNLANYIWNYHMPLLLPELLHYLYSRDQLHDFQHKAITTILCKSIQYYGFTLLTMTNLTQHHKALLHCFLRDYDQHMSCPEIDDERLRGAPNYMTTFFTTHYYATLDSRLQMVQAYRAQNWALHA